MAVLIVELHGTKRGALLPRRVLIGRRSMNHLIIDDPAVSRMHAWIDGEGDRYYINDAGSRTGTRVNGQRIVARHLLGDEDEITIGPSRLTFLAESRLRPGVAPIDLATPPNIAAVEQGILFECPACNAPLWATLNFCGGRGSCKYCSGELVVPHPAAAPAPATKRAAPLRKTNRPATPLSPPPAGRAGGDLPVTREGDGGTASARKSILPPIKRRPEARLNKPTGTAGRPGNPTDPPGQKLVIGIATARSPKSPGNRPAQSGPAGKSRVGVSRPADPRALPGASPARQSAPSSRNGDGEQICGVCHSGISVFEEQTSCPCCALVFHADCWAENHGCSAYGCPQVNILAPAVDHNHKAAEDPALNAGAPAAQAPFIEPPARFPWEFLLLGGSVLSTLISALTFGLPALALAGGAVTYMARTRGEQGPRRGVVMASAALAMLGVLVGIPVSYFLYFGAAHL